MTPSPPNDKATDLSLGHLIVYGRELGELVCLHRSAMKDSKMTLSEAQEYLRKLDRWAEGAAFIVKYGQDKVAERNAPTRAVLDEGGK